MANSKKFFYNRKTILLPIQQFDLKKLYPSYQCYIAKHTLFWSGNIKPHPFSKQYNVSLEYKYQNYPRAFLHEKEIRKDEKIEHTYSVDTGVAEMCLFNPKKGDWNSGMLISQTMVPWITEWLFHYEIWKATGTWNGGGEHPR